MQIENNSGSKGSVKKSGLGEYSLRPYFVVDLSQHSRTQLEEMASRFPRVARMGDISQFDDDTLRRILVELAGTEKIGNVGVTNRSLEQVLEEIPDLIERIQTVGSDKVVFLGNGLSLAPLEVLERLKAQGAQMPDLIIHDILDYRELLQNLQERKQKILSSLGKVSTEMERDIVHCQALIEAEEEGLVTLVTHAFGYDQPMFPSLLNTRLVFNIYGPPRQTIDEQLLLLAEAGSLIGLSAQPTDKDSFNEESILNHGYETGFVVYTKK